MQPILDHALYRLNVVALPFAIVGIALLILSGIIFGRQRAARVAVLFCAMLVLVAVWFLAFTAMLSSGDPGTATFWARVGVTAVCLLPAAIYDFTATAIRIHFARRYAIRALWTVCALFAFASLSSPAVVGSIAAHSWGYYPLPGPLLAAFLMLFAISLTAHLAEYVAELGRTTDPRRRTRLRRLLWSFVIAYAAAIDFAPMFGARLPPLGYVPVLAFMTIAWASIRRHRFAPITAARASREILATMVDALFVLDADGRIRVTNTAVRTLFGYGEEELLGRSIDTIEAETESDQTVLHSLPLLGQRGPIREQQHVFVHKDGHLIDVSLSLAPVLESDVQEGAVLIARDARERKRAQQELHLFMEQLQQSNRELEDFAYVASHDLQEPLRKIQAFADLLKTKHGEGLTPQARDYLDRMQAAARRMQVLINDLLTFSRVTTKAQPFIPVDLNQIAHEVAHDLEIRTHEAGAQVLIGELPPIDADPLQMRQLLQNLISNALKFHRVDVPPIVEIRAVVEDQDGPHARCRIDVADNGIGFEEKYAERIFTMFERLHGRGKYEGTGIGLAICRKIAQRHGGDIVAHSVPGAGSTFSVTLPVHHSNQERAHVDA